MSLLDWIYPPKCISCGVLLPPVHNSGNKFICDECRPVFVPITLPYCPRCGLPLDLKVCPACRGREFYFENNRSAFLYDDVIKDLMHNIKFRSHRRSVQGLGELFAEACSSELEGDYIVPVPLHPSKKRARGFNQAALLAEAVSKAANIKMQADMIIRIRKTKPQSGLDAAARQYNLEGAFALNDKCEINGKTIVVVDDIFTTGATINACAKLLMEKGAGKVKSLSLSIADVKTQPVLQ